METLPEEPEDEELSSLGPIAYAKRLCEKAGLTLEQRGPVALIAHTMQSAYDVEQDRRSKLTEQQRDALANELGGRARLPLVGRLMRILIFGGGGCGKTKIIVEVLTPLFRRFYGPKGCVLTAFSNKAARLVGGKTSHALVKIRGAQSLTMAKLRVNNDKEQRALAAVWSAVGALLKDEFSQQAGPLEHAISVRSMYGRLHAHGLKREDYARPETNYASIPFVVSSGDPLQFPPVPPTASLLAKAEGASKEQKVAELMFQSQDYVCELKTTMRYQGDPVLSQILLKMRTVAEDRTDLKLTPEEWRELQSTDIQHGGSLEGTEMWYHAAYAWSQVSAVKTGNAAIRNRKYRSPIVIIRRETYKKALCGLKKLHVP